MKNESKRLVPFVAPARVAFGRELGQYVSWGDVERPHTRSGARSPDGVYPGSFPASRRPRFETRVRWPRRSQCASTHALIRRRPSAVVKLRVEYRVGREHLPIVSLERVA